MSDDKTRQDGDEIPEADPVADDEVIAGVEDQVGEETSEDGAEDADRDEDESHDEDAESSSKKDASGKDRKRPKVVARKTAKAPVKKTSATRKRSDSAHEEHDPYRAKNPAQFVRQSAAELKKVVWPTWGELTMLFSAVLLFVLFMIAYVGLLDAGFAWALLSLFGGTPQ